MKGGGRVARASSERLAFTTVMLSAPLPFRQFLTFLPLLACACRPDKPNPGPSSAATTPASMLYLWAPPSATTAEPPRDFSRLPIATQTPHPAAGPTTLPVAAATNVVSGVASQVGLSSSAPNAPARVQAGGARRDQAPRPGVYVNADPVKGRCTRARCMPLCLDPATPPNSEFPDWGWENNQSCIIASSDTALVAGGDRTEAIRNHGYVPTPRPCTVGQPPLDLYEVPRLDKAKLHAAAVDSARVGRRPDTPRFTTRGRQLLDAYGTPFIPRAVNNANGWYDICAQYLGLEALDNIAATGANAVRIGWAFESIDPGGPHESPLAKSAIGTNPDLLAEVLHRTVELGLIPIVTFNDSTGQTDPAWADAMATKITAPKYLRLFKAYEPYLLLGLANELNVPLEDFAQTYRSAIRRIRSKGYRGTLVVTANEWGQGCDSLLTFGPMIVAEDPLHNVLFDLHVYTYVHHHRESEPNRFAGGEPERIAGCLDEVAELELPLLVGEFGHSHSSGPVAWQTIIQRANANQQGYAPWLWYGDTEYPQLNMSRTWEGPLTEWGQKATTDFLNSSRRASVLQ